jgi:FAD/FMN-containing dehydrogenase
MNRRTLLKLFGGAGLWLASPFKSLAKATGFTRVRPGQKGWPSEAQWKHLEKAVGGNLIKIKSPIEACKTTAAKCGDLFAKDLKNPYLIGDDPALTQTLGWVNAWTSKPSVYAVAARNAQDMAAGVNFAREHKLRVAVRGGGHSYLGTSNAPDSLLLWTRKMNDITLHDDFVPQGCSIPPQPAVTCGAGVIWGHAYDAVVRQAGRYVQGGGCATVNVAGLVQSGGFGSFSKHYGMCCAGLLEAEVVTADGKRRTVNQCQDPDLFWALKGGGGGSFGVVTRVTLRVRELVENFGAALFKVKAATDNDFRQLVRKFLDFYGQNLFNEHWGEQVQIEPGNVLNVSMVCAGLKEDQVRATWQPLLEWIAQSPQAYTLIGQPMLIAVPAQHWWDAEFMNKLYPGVFALDPRPGAGPRDAWWTNDAGQVGQYMYGYDSLWLPESLLATDARPKLTDALFAASRHRTVQLHFNKGLAGARADEIAAANDIATNPAVQSAFTLAIVGAAQDPAYPGIPGHEPDMARGKTAAQNIDACMAELKKIAPDGGSYVSESNFFNKDWQRAYWGTNYSKLAAIKRKYDPDGLFTVHNGVGSEEWSADGFTRVG